MKTKKFDAFEGKPPILYRPGTSDESIINAIIVEKREYAFPVLAPKIVFDVGANIGVVSVLLANIYPAAKIFAFEPIKENYELLSENVKEYKNISPMQVGLGNKTESRTVHYSTDPTNLGGFSTFLKDGEAAEQIDIIKTAIFCDKVGTPDLIKIDCEGAEFEILSDIPELDKVQWITGELHGINDYKLLDRLAPNFELSFCRSFGDKVWHFQALSKSIIGPQS